MVVAIGKSFRIYNSCSENLKKQQQIAKKQGKILEKYLCRNSFFSFTGIFKEFVQMFKHIFPDHCSRYQPMFFLTLIKTEIFLCTIKVKLF